MKTLKSGFILLLTVLLFNSCGYDKPDDLLKEETYLEIFTELILLNQMRDEHIAPVSRDYLSDQIFERHGVTHEQFNTSHHYYQKDAEAHLDRISKIEKKLNDERALIQAIIDSVESKEEESSPMHKMEVQEADNL